MPKTYTEEEASHLIAREVAKQRMNDMDRNISGMDKKNTNAFNTLKLSIESLRQKISSHSKKVDHCRIELRDEIERDFVTKTEFVIELAKLERKVDSLSIKITTAVAILMFVIQYGFKVWGG